MVTFLFLSPFLLFFLIIGLTFFRLFDLALWTTYLFILWTIMCPVIAIYIDSQKQQKLENDKGYNNPTISETDQDNERMSKSTNQR